MKSTKSVETIATTTHYIANKLRGTKGRMFSVVFLKKDGTERRLAGRLGVTKNLVGGVNTVKHLPQYLTVGEFGNKDAKGQVVYRNVNLDTIISAKVGGKVYVVHQSSNQGGAK